MIHETAELFLEQMRNLPRQEFMRDRTRCGIYLKRLAVLLRCAGNPERSFRYIHIAGTSGKGSTARMIAGILSADGRRVGLYTSPHVSRFTERFFANGRESTEHELAALVPKLHATLTAFMQRSPLEFPSYFEIDFLLALLWFKQTRVRWAVIETGCGGRYDATNIIPHPDIAVITTIGLDHTEILGSTKKEIAHEKIGIVKPGAHVIIGEENPAIRMQLARTAKRQGAASIVCVETTDAYPLRVLGEHQKKNAAVAAAVAHRLGISDKTIARALVRVKIPAACEVVGTAPLVIIDGAHNPDKLATTADCLRALKQKHGRPAGGRRLHLIYGVAHNKNVPACLATVLPLADVLYCTRFSNNTYRTAADPRTLTATARRLRPALPATPYLFAADAWRAARRAARPRDIIAVTGSLFLAGEIKNMYNRRRR